MTACGILHTSCSMSMPSEMIAGRHAFLALLRGGEVAFNTLTIWQHCFACCLLLLSISAFGADLRSGVVRVTDGDTIVVNVGVDQHKIRLSGVDAPDLAQDFGKVSRAKRWQECCNSRKDCLLKGALAN